MTWWKISLCSNTDQLRQNYYIPFSTQAGDFDVNQWFNNSVVAGLKSGNKNGQKEYLENLIMPDRDDPRGICFYYFYSL